MPTTIKDVARLAGVAVSTASVALRGREHVGEETRRRVLHAARVLNYRPNRFARSLVTRRTGLVGVILSDLTEPAAAELFRGAHAVAAEYGYTLVPRLTYSAPGREEGALADFAADRVDGVLVLEGCAPRFAAGAGAAGAYPPVVRVGTERSPAPAVRVAEAAAMRTVVEYLAQHGHRRIACLVGPRTGQRNRARAAGYRRALLAHRCGFRRELLRFLPPDPGMAAAAVRELLQGEDPPTAVAVGHELLAAGVLEACHELGVAVPEDLSVGAVGGRVLLGHFRPQLARVEVPLYDAGRHAARLLILRLDGRNGGPAEEHEKVEVRGTFVAGASVRRIPAAVRPLTGLRTPLLLPRTSG